LQIRLGVRYLKDVLKMRFPELRARAAAAEAEARRREVITTQPAVILLHAATALSATTFWLVCSLDWSRTMIDIVQDHLMSSLEESPIL
jgi:hypothetical protein